MLARYGLFALLTVGLSAVSAAGLFIGCGVVIAFVVLLVNSSPTP